MAGIEPWKERALELKTAGVGPREIARSVGKPYTTVWDFLSRNTLPGHLPKILLCDIETAPTKAYVWSRWKNNVYQDQVISEGFVLTWAAKWLGGDTIFSDALPNYPNYATDPEDDSEIIRAAWHLLDEADILVFHNGDRFDIPWLNTRFLYFGLDQPGPYKTVDTLKILKRHFKFPSNRLDSVGEYLGLGRKLETGGFPLWKDCLNGDDDAWRKMVDYNCEDILLLERLYLRIRAWDRLHPNASLYSDNSVLRCVVCGSDSLEPLDKFAYTATGAFSVFKCGSCGKHNRSRVTAKSTDQRQNILVNVGK